MIYQVFLSAVAILSFKSILLVFNLSLLELHLPGANPIKYLNIKKEVCKLLRLKVFEISIFNIFDTLNNIEINRARAGVAKPLPGGKKVPSKTF